MLLLGQIPRSPKYWSLFLASDWSNLCSEPVSHMFLVCLFCIPLLTQFERRRGKVRPFAFGPKKVKKFPLAQKIPKKGGCACGIKRPHYHVKK